MSKHSLVVIVWILIFRAALPAAASESDDRLWGIWKKVDGVGFDSYLIFTPNGAWGLTWIEGLIYGTYSTSSDVLQVNMTVRYAETTHSVVNWSYEVVGDMLTVNDDDGMFGDHQLVTKFTEAAFSQCPDSVTNNLFVGAYGQIAFTDGRASRLRDAPGVNGVVIDGLAEGRLFVVTGEPVCADGFTWWPIHTNPKNPGSGSGTNNVTTGWIAEGDSESAFIEPVGWIDVFLLSGSPRTTPQALESLAEVNEAQFYRPGEYPFAEAIGQALESGEAAGDNIRDLIDSSFLIVKDTTLDDNPAQIVCMARSDTQIDVAAAGDETTGFDCLIFDLTDLAILREPMSLTIPVMIEILSYPKTPIDPWRDSKNDELAAGQSSP